MAFQYCTLDAPAHKGKSAITFYGWTRAVHEVPSLELALTALGNMDWELVSVINTTTGYRYHFKRSTRVGGYAIDNVVAVIESVEQRRIADELAAQVAQEAPQVVVQESPKPKTGARVLDLADLAGVIPD